MLVMPGSLAHRIARPPEVSSEWVAGLHEWRGTVAGLGYWYPQEMAVNRLERIQDAFSADAWEWFQAYTRTSIGWMRDYNSSPGFYAGAGHIVLLGARSDRDGDALMVHELLHAWFDAHDLAEPAFRPELSEIMEALARGDYGDGRAQEVAANVQATPGNLATERYATLGGYWWAEGFELPLDVATLYPMAR